MTFYELTTLTAGIFHLVLTIFVLSRDLRSSINRTYCLWGLSLTLWNLASFMKYQAYLQHDAVAGLAWLRLLHLSVVFLPVSNLHLYFLIGRIHKPRFLAGLYAVTVCIAASIVTPFYIRDIRPMDFGYVVVGGPAFYAFMAAYFATGVVTSVLVYQKQVTLPPIHRSRLRALLFAYVTLALAGLHDLIPVLGLSKYPLLGIKVYPIGNMAAIVFGLVVAYGVLQHQLLNVHVTLSRMAAQLVRISFMFFLGFTLLVLLFRLAPPNSFSPFSLFSALIVLLVTAVLTSVLFPRFFGKGAETLERRILGDRFEYQDRVQGFIRTIPFYAESDMLLADLHQLLVGTVGVKSYQIILLDEARRVFSLFRSQPPHPAEQIEDLTLNAPIFHFFRTTRAEYLSYKLAYSMPGETEPERAARKQLREYDPEFCFPLVAEGYPFGLLLVGEKSSGEPYTRQDLELMVEMVKNLGLVINQIRLKKQLLLAEEMELLGTMSRGIAHDLNNLMTPVWTYLQLAQAGIQNAEVREELLPSAMRNVETMRSYIKEALFFSKTQSLQLRKAPMDKIIQSAVALIQPLLKKQGINVTMDVPAGVEAEIDEVLMQRLVGNLLSNAIDASPIGSAIKIQLLKLAKTEANRDWLRLQVIDHGEGISPENLKRVATPYFTTKDRGGRARGFGLGLAICRKIVHLHGGQLTIDSELNKGTTVHVDLPSRQIAPANPVVSFSS